MLALEPVAFESLDEAVTTVRVPEVYAEIYPGARDRILAIVKSFEQKKSGPGAPPLDQPDSPDLDR